ncbi:MAG: tRNA pseudouridine55 synthase [Parcubacteria group bacterium Gr01-1014_70]|nr:MAG: tRNA pseudouridine55 synthase [Parcubacteria group bacterium Gr01-1014_70]
MPRIFAVYKPKGLTSNAVLNRLRRAAGTKKIGHAGTLDPLAEGVLVVGVGKEATKQLAHEVAKEKEYVADILLGATSITDDAEGEKTERTGYEIPSEESIQNALRQFVGIITQTPPLYSAVKVKGQEAYKRARKGEAIELEPRNVEVKSIVIETYQWPHLTIHVVCGPGTYIRAIARDVGGMLGTGGYLTGLVRTRVGQWRAEDALSLAEAEERCVEWKHSN